MVEEVDVLGGPGVLGRSVSRRGRPNGQGGTRLRTMGTRPRTTGTERRTAESTTSSGGETPGERWGRRATIVVVVVVVVAGRRRPRLPPPTAPSSSSSSAAAAAKENSGSKRPFPDNNDDQPSPSPQPQRTPARQVPRYIRRLVHRGVQCAPPRTCWSLPTIGAREEEEVMAGCAVNIFAQYVELRGGERVHDLLAGGIPTTPLGQTRRLGSALVWVQGRGGRAGAGVGGAGPGPGAGHPPNSTNGVGLWRDGWGRRPGRARGCDGSSDSGRRRQGGNKVA